MVSYGGRIRVNMHKATCTSASTHEKVMTTQSSFKEIFMMRIGIYMHRVKLVLVCAGI